ANRRGSGVLLPRNTRRETRSGAAEPEGEERPLSMRRKEILFTLVVIAVMCAFAGAHAEDPGGAAESPAGEARTRSLLDLYTPGGMPMHPILLCSMGTSAVAAYCFVQVNPKKMSPKAQVDALTQLLRRQDPAGAYEQCQMNPNSLSAVMSAALLKVNFERDLS